MRTVLLFLILLFGTAHAEAELPPTDLSALFPADGVIAGWTRTEELKSYRGDELFLMIDGGADIYHEYGFAQVMAGEYQNREGKLIRLEIYQMQSPDGAYGIYSFKTGRDGESQSIGQEALLEEYYLNFWKADLLVTVVGSDAERQTIQGVIALGRYVDRHYSREGGRPKLVELLRHEPLAFSHPKYVRGAIGVMNIYVFDTEDIFQVSEGVIGTIGDARAFVFRYSDTHACATIFGNASDKIAASHRYSEVERQEDLISMVDRNRNFLVVRRAGQDIVAVIGEESEKVRATAEQMVTKLKDL